MGSNPIPSVTVSDGLPCGSPSKVSLGRGYGDEKDGAGAKRAREAASRGREILRAAASKIPVTESHTLRKTEFLCPRCPYSNILEYGRDETEISFCIFAALRGYSYANDMPRPGLFQGSFRLSHRCAGRDNVVNKDNISSIDNIFSSFK